MNDASTTPGITSADDAAAKRPWHTPGLEQVAYPDTEVGSGSYTYSDNTTYNS